MRLRTLLDRVTPAGAVHERAGAAQLAISAETGLTDFEEVVPALRSLPQIH
jgi:hypothetical protein